MDMKSLSSAEKASVLWANVIEKEKLWEKLYKKNVGSIFTFIDAIFLLVFLYFRFSSHMIGK